MPSTGLLTDRYELTMLDAALQDGSGDRRCVFEVFARSLPEGRGYGVVAGTSRLLDALGRFSFGDEQLRYLEDAGVVSPTTLDWLATYRFTGDIYGYREGELYVPDSPILTVVGSFAETVLLESLVLSILNHDSAVASAAARMVQAAGGRPLMEFGSRRTHEDAAVAAARAAVLVGFAGTSNLEAGRRHGVPTLGTSAHAFTLLHDDEASAFDAQVAAQGSGTTLLVDTYDVAEGVERAIRAGGPELGGIRIDSGDLADHAVAARGQLDAAGLTGTRIVVSGDLDEYRIASLADAPIDGYGVGTSVVTGSGAPAAGMVYKLVARASGGAGDLEVVAKSGGDKATVGGQKAASRRLADGVATAEVLQPWGSPPDPDARPLQTPLVIDGQVVDQPDLEAATAHHRMAIGELSPEARSLQAARPGFPTLVLADPPLEHPTRPRTAPSATPEGIR
ncbi:MAG: nicotinate phosphoribosyltransferase [Nitriliruptor sp.]|nr:MAG: nicotinate phosphoribosyltransferase [Nitriliruptor sp.]